MIHAKTLGLVEAGFYRRDLPSGPPRMAALMRSPETRGLFRPPTTNEGLMATLRSSLSVPSQGLFVQPQEIYTRSAGLSSLFSGGTRLDLLA
jgi:hypothetical protein